MAFIEPIIVYPETPEQMAAIKEFLDKLEVYHEPQNAELPPHVLKSIEIGLKQYEAGQTISLEEFKARYLFKK